jgi:hypothetical protein
MKSKKIRDMDGSFYCIFNGIQNSPLKFKTIESEFIEDKKNCLG